MREGRRRRKAPWWSVRRPNGIGEEEGEPERGREVGGVNSGESGRCERGRCVWERGESVAP